MTEKTTDEYIMPFGKYKGKAIGDVPASYLLWFYEQVWSTKHRAVYGYVFEHKKLLERRAYGKWADIECDATEEAEGDWPKDKEWEDDIY